MKTCIPLAIATLIILAFEQSLTAQTFDFTLEQFRQKYNNQLKSDNGDLIKTCTKKANDEISCNFDITNFRTSVQAFKQLDLANGQFELNENLLLSMDGGKVKKVIISGSRKDPMNLFHFVGQLGSLILTLNPEFTQDEVTSMIAKKLGIMRGDDDPTIGKPIVEITKKFAATCNNQLSTVSTRLGCIFEPRY
jgi:hypothetical protein